MEALFEILFQFLGEFLLQFLFEAFADIGFDLFDKTVQSAPRPMLWALGCLLLGTLAGGISLLILPHSMIVTPSLRILNVIGTPVLVSSCMLVIGNWRAAKGREPVKLDRFSNAFCFAVAMALVRFAYAR
jgi:hypothetical protein